MLTSRFSRIRPRTPNKLFIVSTIVCVLLSLAAFRMRAQSSGTSLAKVPKGWMLAGSNPANYQTGVDSQVSANGSPSAYLISKEGANEGFGTLMQMFSAGDYLGKRIRLTASVKAKDVNDWAGLWMRVDKGTSSVGFDNMQDRPIKGTTGWQQCQVVLDVPENASGIAFGILLNKSGSVWLSGVKFEVVGTDVATTGNSGNALAQSPVNLDFRN